MPEFFISFYKRKLVKKLIEKINEFKTNFVTATEEDWVLFMKKESRIMQNFENKMTYIPENLNMEVLKTVLSIMVVMPIKADMKHDIGVIEKKLSRL